MSRPPILSSRPHQPDVYATHYGRLLAYARKLTGDRSVAEDLVQEAWCLVDRRRPENVEAPFRYLRTVIHNLFVSNLRRQKREPGSGLSPDALHETLASELPSPEEAVISILEMERLHALIDAMPPRQATALRMYHFENRKLREVAAHLNVSISFAQALIAKGLEICAEELDRTVLR